MGIGKTKTKRKEESEMEKIGPPKWTEIILGGKLQRLYFLNSPGSKTSASPQTPLFLQRRQ